MSRAEPIVTTFEKSTLAALISRPSVEALILATTLEELIGVKFNLDVEILPAPIRSALIVPALILSADKSFIFAFVIAALAIFAVPTAKLAIFALVTAAFPMIASVTAKFAICAVFTNSALPLCSSDGSDSLPELSTAVHLK